MFGIDLGITVSSISCITIKNQIIDFCIFFGNTSEKDHWTRCTQMSEALVDGIVGIVRGNPKILIEPLVAIEEPVFPFRTRNPQSYFNMCCLYALTRNKLHNRGFTIYSIHPLSAKAIAKKLVYERKRLKEEYMKRGSLTKKGMVKAFSKLIGKPPSYHTVVGRETLADSFFIAKAGIEKRKMEL